MHLILQAHVTKLILDLNEGVKRVVGVEFSDRKGNGDKRYLVQVRKEAVLS